MALTVSMPLIVSTRKDWFSAPRLNFSFSRARSTGVNSSDSSTYTGMEAATISVSSWL